MSTAPDVSKRRKPSGSASGWRAMTKSTLALVVATASERSAKADVSLSTGTPCFSHSTANITHLHAEDTALGCALNLLRSCLVPYCTNSPMLTLGLGVTATGIANTLTDRGSRNPYGGDSSSDGMVSSFLPRTKPAARPAAFATASRPR
jgi:hypothetical protein